MLHLVPAAADGAGSDGSDDIAVDVAFLPHLGVAGHVAALVRPDHYLFGAVPALDQVAGLIGDLQRQLGPAPGLAGEFYRILDQLAVRLGGPRRLLLVHRPAGRLPAAGAVLLLRERREPRGRQRPGGARRHPRADPDQQGHAVGPAQAAPRAPSWQRPGRR